MEVWGSSRARSWLFSPEEAATYTSLGIGKIRQAIRGNRLPAKRDGRDIILSSPGSLCSTGSMRTWLNRVTGGATAREVSQLVPYSYSTVARWIRTDSIPCEAIVKIARAYHANVLEALVATGHIAMAEAGRRIGANDAVRSVPDAVLLEEVRRRLLGASTS